MHASNILQLPAISSCKRTNLLFDRKTNDKRKIYNNYNKCTKNPNKFYIKEDKKRYNYIPIKCHYICNVVEDGEIVVQWVSSGEHPLDPFTKGLVHDRHSIHVKTIDMRNDVKF